MLVFNREMMINIKKPSNLFSFPNIFEHSHLVAVPPRTLIITAFEWLTTSP